MKVFRCKVCGKVILMMHETKVPTMCCGQEMEEEVANVTEAASEKHLPVCEVEGQNIEVKVGDVAHPMTEEHYITWIAIEMEDSIQIHYLQPEQEPKTTFVVAANQTVKKVYAYCNLHHLWMKELS